MKLNSNLELKGVIEVNFKVNFNNKEKVKKWVMTVAKAAPYKLNLGIKIKFKIMLIIAPDRTAQKNFFCWLEAINR